MEETKDNDSNNGSDVPASALKIIDIHYIESALLREMHRLFDEALRNRDCEEIFVDIARDNLIAYGKIREMAGAPKNSGAEEIRKWVDRFDSKKQSSQENIGFSNKG